MVIWLNNTHRSVGIDTDVIRKEELSCLTDIQTADKQLNEEYRHRLNDAQDAAEALLEQARQQADAILQEAEQKYEQAGRLGYAAGRQEAVNEWHAKAMHTMVDIRHVQHNMKERLAQLVINVTEQVILSENRQALYRRVAKQLDKSMADSTFMKLTVCPDDADLARRSFAQLNDSLGWNLPIEVVEDSQLPGGACLCEWDYGVMDASLHTQLAAIRKAVRQVIVPPTPEDTYNSADEQDDTTGNYPELMDMDQQSDMAYYNEEAFHG